MEYIDKSHFLGREQEIDRNFLEECFNEDSKSFYPEIDTDQSYSNFSNRTYRKGTDGWERLLLEEQDGRCCYCMKKLQVGALNIEHVIPRNIQAKDDGEEFAKYINASPFLEQNVELASDFAKKQFTNKEELSEVTKFPHRIALPNLLASCNGKFGKPSDGCCCNNARSNDYLLPLMLMPEAKQHIRYDRRSGIIVMYPEEKSWEKLLQTLNDDTYKEIRLLWYKAWLHKDKIKLESLADYDTKERTLFLNLIFDVDNFTQISEEYQKYAGILTGDSTYWKLFLDFDWFFNYNWT